MDGVILYAWVLMSNHYHLLIETPRGNVSAFMHRLNTAYGMYYRYKHRRPGHVLHGRFQHRVVEGDDYLLRLTRYLHLNPVKTKEMKKKSEEFRLNYLRQYPWSSYRGYVEEGRAETFVQYRWRELINGQSLREQRERYRRYVEGFVVRDDEELLKVLNRSEHAIGNEDFVGKVEQALRDEYKETQRSGDVAWPREPAIKKEDIENQVAKEFGCRKEDLKRHGHVAKAAKAVAIELACNLGGLSHREAGLCFGGITGAGVAYQRNQLKAMMKQDKTLAGKLKQIRARLLSLGL